MFVYKDYSYVKYVLALSCVEGIKLFNECTDRANNQLLWEIYLVEIQNGFEGTFEEYKKAQLSKTEVTKMTAFEKDSEQERIINKIINLERKMKNA